MVRVSWRVVPILGCGDVRSTAEWYRDVLGFTLDPENGLFIGVVPDEGAVGGVEPR